MRRRLLQIPFWILYNYIWWAITIGHPVTALHDILFTSFGVKFSFYVFFQILAVYVNLYFLMPRFFETRRYAAYISSLFLLIGVTSFLIIPGYYLSAHICGKTVQDMFGKDACWYHFLGNSLSSTFGCMTLAMSVQLAWQWNQTKKREQALEKEKLETELNFLKYQFNPHFLFNTINSIFFLIHKNPDMASESLAKFSELLRYQLYDCDENQIPLTREIAYLENFVELERLRQNGNMEIRLELTRDFNPASEIAPFILMTFVENAFKHVSRHSDRTNFIFISLEQTEGLLEFSVRNSIAAYKNMEVVHYSGIGLKNVRRRLDLIYPGEHELQIDKTPAEFIVRLKLNLQTVNVQKQKFAS